MSQSFHSSQPPLCYPGSNRVTSLASERIDKSIWEHYFIFIFFKKMQFRQKKDGTMAPYLCEKHECVCVCLGIWFIRVALEHSMMPNLANRGFFKEQMCAGCRHYFSLQRSLSVTTLNWSSQSQCSASYQKRAVIFFAFECLIFFS